MKIDKLLLIIELLPSDVTTSAAAVAYWEIDMGKCNSRSRVTIAVFIAAFFLSSSSISAEERKTKPDNCNLESPPEMAGDDSYEGTLIKIFPRKSDMGESYSGCQTMWAKENGRWQAAMVGIFEDGEVVRMKLPLERNDRTKNCLRKSRELIRGENENCSAMDAFPWSSVDTNCRLSTIRDRGIKCPYD